MIRRKRMRPLNSACLGRPHHISPPHGPLRFLQDNRIRTRPGPRLATGHLASSLVSSPTSHLNLGVRCLSYPPPPQLYPSEGKRRRPTWGSFSGVSRSRFSGCRSKIRLPGGLRGAPLLEQTGVLLLVFSGSQEGRWPLSYLGSKSVEQTFEEIQFQNVNTRLSFTLYKKERMVYIDRSERCFLPHKHLFSAQKMSSFRLPRHVLRVYSPAIWPLPQSKDFLPVHGGGFEPAKDSGSQDPDLYSRLADYSRFKRERDAKHCPCARSHHSARLQSECEEKQFHSCPECEFSRSGAKFHHNAPNARAHSLLSEVPFAVQGGCESTVSHVSQITESHGCSYPCPASRPSENEGVHEVGFISYAIFAAQSQWRARAQQRCGTGGKQSFTCMGPPWGPSCCGRW